MVRSALNQDKIVLATIDLAGKIGLENVSFPRLAEYFGIKSPSLYNHFKNMDEVRVATAVYLQKNLNHQLTQAMVSKMPLEALRSYSQVYKAFADEYAPVYELVNMIRQARTEELMELSRENIRLISRSLEAFDFSPEEVVHLGRTFRSGLHGFITLEQLGYFQKDEVTKADSYVYMVELYLQRLVDMSKDLLKKSLKALDEPTKK